MKKLFIPLLFIMTGACGNNPKPVKIAQEDSLNIKNLTDAVWSLPFKHKDIIIAQAVLETGWFKSNHCVNNNNLFGMKKCYSRLTTADTVINGYSHYPNWRMSVVDYYILQSTRDFIVKSDRATYFNYLDKTYSDDGRDYSKQLKQIIAKLDLDNDDPKPVIKKRQHKKTKHKRHGH